MKYKKASVVIIENELGQVLMLQRTLPPHGLCFPGGKVDEGETAAIAGMRECYEETQIILNLYDEDFRGTVISATEQYEVSVFYKKVALEGVVLSPREHIGYMWTSKPVCGFAGNTLDMVRLWPNFK